MNEAASFLRGPLFLTDRNLGSPYFFVRHRLHDGQKPGHPPLFLSVIAFMTDRNTGSPSFFVRHRLHDGQKPGLLLFFWPSSPS
jgi:hypothetical protein